MSDFEGKFGKWSWEIQKEQQAKVEELQKQAHTDKDLIQLLKKANKDLVVERDELISKYNNYDKLLFQRNKDEQKLYDINEKHVAEKAELQKRVDKALSAINEHYDSDGMSGLMFIDLKEILEGEQALKGED